MEERKKQPCCPNCGVPRRYWQRVLRAGFRRCGKCKVVFNMLDCKWK